jgi:threonine/homoserine/homoserine lactone efflux protein
MLTTFVIASLLLAVTPGPAVIYGRVADPGGGMRQRARRLARFGRHFGASTFFGLGVYTALAGPRSGR